MIVFIRWLSIHIRHVPSLGVSNAAWHHKDLTFPDQNVQIISSSTFLLSSAYSVGLMLICWQLGKDAPGARSIACCMSYSGGSSLGNSAGTKIRKICKYLPCSRWFPPLLCGCLCYLLNSWLHKYSHFSIARTALTGTLALTPKIDVGQA